MKPDVLYNGVICRYHEIATKGANRRMFEAKFMEGLRRCIPDPSTFKFAVERGRITMHRKDLQAFTAPELSSIVSGFPRAFGLESFSPCLIVESELAAIEQAVKDSFPPHYLALASQMETIPYRMRARRSHKRFALKSKELEIHFADLLLEGYPKLQVDLINAVLTVGVEIRERRTFVFYEQYAGPGGLPSGCSGRVLALLSGGIDSPVACYMTMKRGCSLDYLTFHSFPYTPEATIHKVAGLVRVLNRFQEPGRLFACNLVTLQKAVRDGCSSRFRTVLYRRMMMRIAERLARQLKDDALLTGEAIGQVASQTLRNLHTINEATDMLVIRPLISMDKHEAIKIAQRIGTFELSIEDCPDSCTVFAPGNPATGSFPDLVARDEAQIEMETLIQQTLAEEIMLIDPETGDGVHYPVIAEV